MTANELADILENRSAKLIGKENEMGGRAFILYGEAAAMLRQQQSEIAELKKQLSMAYEENENYWMEKENNK